MDWHGLLHSYKDKVDHERGDETNAKQHKDLVELIHHKRGRRYE